MTRKKITTEQWVEKAKKVNGDKFDYSQVNYNGQYEKVWLKCNICGYTFLKTPKRHLLGDGCKNCNTLKQRKTTNQFIKEAKEKHGNKYDYSLVVYTTAFNKVTLICPKHGEFKIEPKGHVYRGDGCCKCAQKVNSDNLRKTTFNFIKEASLKHNNLYNYDKVSYINNSTKVIINCSIHGDFLQNPKEHLQGQGCPICRCSKGETLIYNWLKENNIPFKREFEIMVSKIARNTNKLRVDFFVKYRKKQYFIEYDGEQHFKYIPFFHKGGKIDFEKQQRRDNVLDEFCELHKDKVTLIKFNYNMKEEEIIKQLYKKIIQYTNEINNNK